MEVWRVMLIALGIILFIVAIVLSMLGQGGGVVYTPVQVLFGIDFHTAAATSLFLIMVMSLSSSLVYRKAHKIDWSLAIALETATTTGGFIGGLWSGRFSGTFLSFLLAAVIVLAAVFMVREFNTAHRCAEDRSDFFSWRRTVGGQPYCVNMALALPLSFAAGLVSGMIGVGGGILKVPMMVLLFGIPMDIAVGSSAFMVGVTAAGGFAGHVVSGHWDWRASLILAVAVFAGGQIGSRLAVQLDEEKLKRVFGWFLLAIAAVMVARTLMAG